MNATGRSHIGGLRKKPHDLLKAPLVVGYASGHRGCHLERLRGAAEVVIHVVEADGVRQVLDLL